jgi:hypothetical protein
VTDRTFRERLSTAPAAIARGLSGVVREMAPVVLFFFVAFLLLFLIFKFFAAKYSIEFSAVSKAALAALILGKVIPVLEWAQSRYRFNTHRRAVVVLCKTFIYALVVSVLLIAEKIFQGFRETGSVLGGIRLVIANASLDRALGIVLVFSLVVGSYLVLKEIDRAMGKGALFKLFLAPPLADADRKLTNQGRENPGGFG